MKPKLIFTIGDSLHI